MSDQNSNVGKRLLVVCWPVVLFGLVTMWILQRKHGKIEGLVMVCRWMETHSPDQEGGWIYTVGIATLTIVGWAWLILMVNLVMT